jgi:MFS family permease
MSEPARELAAPHSGTEAWGTVAALCLIQFVDVMGVCVVVAGLPVMLAGVGAEPQGGGLVATGYAACFGGLLMFGARLGDRIGHRRCIIASLAVFAAGGLLAATAASVVALTAARCLQGAAAAAAVPSSLSLLTVVTGAGPARARAIAAWSATGATAGAFGFVAGGLVVQLASWRAIFWGLLALAAVQAAAVVALVPRDPGNPERPPLNLGGSALLTAAVVLVVIGTSLAADPANRLDAVLLLGAGALASALFTAADRRSSAPLLPPAALARPAVRRGTVGAFCNTAVTSGAAVLATLFLQGSLRLTPLAAAATLLPFSILVVAGSAGAGRMVARRPGERVAALGLVLIGAGVALPLMGSSSELVIGGGLGVAGLGLGLSSVATTAMAMEVPQRLRATASGVVNTSAQLGTALGTAALLVVAITSTGPPGTGAAAPSIAWAAAGLLAVTAGLAYLKVRPAAPHPTSE